MDHPLKIYRDANEIGQREIARRVDRAVATVSRWEAGERAPRIEDMIAIERATDGAVTVAAQAEWWARRQTREGAPA